MAERIPFLEQYGSPCSAQGTIETVTYNTQAYALERIYHQEHIPLQKRMFVYLPYQYDPTKKYPVLYLMHGGTDHEGYWFGEDPYQREDTVKYTPVGNITQNLLDHMIFEKIIDPLIVVTPSFCEDVEAFQKRPEYAAVYFQVVNYFWMELKNDIMPYIQSHYATYAADETWASAQQAREHMAYAGCSQGSITGLNSVMAHLLDAFSCIGSFSAGIIQHHWDGQELKLTLDTQKIGEVAGAVNQGSPIRFWYNGCGDHDQMYDTHRATYDALISLCGGKLRGQDQENGNCVFALRPGGEHRYRDWIEDLYSCLRFFFGISGDCVPSDKKNE